MNKFATTIIVVILGCLAGYGYMTYKKQQTIKQAEARQLAIASQQAKEKADAQALNQKKRDEELTKRNKDAAEAQEKLDAEVSTVFSGLKVESTILGTPNIVIISKKDYEEGQDFVLPSGIKLKIKSIEDTGVVFVAPNGKIYELKKNILLK